MVLPMLNESSSAARVVDRLFGAFETSDRALFVVCVDDGSTDQTASVLDRLQERHPRLDVVTHETCGGYGAAIRSGLARAATPIVGWMDADGQYEPADLHELIAALDGEVVGAVGVRVRRADELYRKWLGSAGTLLASLICGSNLRDADAGLKVFRSELVDLEDLRSNGSFISTEVLRRSLAVGRVAQLEIDHFPREFGEQTGASVRVLAGLVFDFVRCIGPGARIFKRKAAL